MQPWPDFLLSSVPIVFAEICLSCLLCFACLHNALPIGLPRCIVPPIYLPRCIVQYLTLSSHSCWYNSLRSGGFSSPRYWYNIRTAILFACFARFSLLSVCPHCCHQAVALSLSCFASDLCDGWLSPISASFIIAYTLAYSVQLYYLN